MASYTLYRFFHADTNANGKILTRQHHKGISNRLNNLKNIETKSVINNMRAIDLFSGAGGMSLGASHAGINIVGAIENDLHAANTFAHNFPSTRVYASDIQGIAPSEFSKIDLVFGGPPCQGFSTSNQRNRSSSNTSNWLFKEFFRFVDGLSPQWVVLENVKGILETESGFFFQKICNYLEQLGYTTTYQLLDSSHFSVPQRRNRVFVIGTKLDTSFSFPTNGDSKIITVKDAIADLPNLTNGASKSLLQYTKEASSEYANSLRSETGTCSNHLVTKNSELILKRYRHIPQGGNWECIPSNLMANYKNPSRCHTGIYKRLEWNKPSCVIGNYRKNMLIHPEQHRGLSVREAARLQSFPDDFEFTGSIGFQQQQVGNAVPPKLSEAIFTAIMRS